MTAHGTAWSGVRDAAHLSTLPDGTIISWLRMAGDPTSEAVAFVRREIEYDDGPNGPTATGGPHVTVWISPGGWDPMTIAEAGVTYPAQVVRLGVYDPDHYLSSEMTTLGETLSDLASAPLLTGGTWAREKALECAAQLWQGKGGVEGYVLEAAEMFAAWLDRDDQDDASSPSLMGLPTIDSGMGQPR